MTPLARLLDRGAFIREPLNEDRRAHPGPARFADSACAVALAGRDEDEIRAAGVVAQYQLCLEPAFRDGATIKLLESLARRHLSWTAEEAKVLLELTRGHEHGWDGAALRLPLAAAERVRPDLREILWPRLVELLDTVAVSVLLPPAKRARAVAKIESLLPSSVWTWAPVRDRAPALTITQP